MYYSRNNIKSLKRRKKKIKGGENGEEWGMRRDEKEKRKMGREEGKQYTG